ncbi:MAG: pilus assembly protein [Pseudomonadota bacterium]
MTTSTLQKTFAKIKPQHWLGALALLGTTAFFIELALAITAFNPQDQPTGYVGQDELSNFNLAGGGETVYRPEYEKEYWSGNLYAYPVDAAGQVNTAAERWSGGAKENIDLQNFDTGRLIATMKDDGSGVPFRSISGISASQLASLATTVNSIAYTGAQILDFLRGDRSNESASTLRVRQSALGDIVHMRPYYVPNALTPTIFAGANDGMLHAINTTDGSERWAYVPSMLINKMKNLAANPYTHDYFVDGQINIGQVTISAQLKRVLVGGLGGGGKGLYALDVTTLSAASEADVASKILWEITPTTVNYAAPTGSGGATGFSNLGYTYGTPVIAKVQNGASTQDVMIIGNGYNDSASGNYQAYLYVIDISNGQLIRSIMADTAATPDGTAASPNGLSSPVALDSDGDGAVDLVYAGDLNGTMWKFDMSSTSPASWTASVLLTTSPAQPITSTPGVAIHPMGGYMINFGTGEMFAAADASKAGPYYVYGIWDSAPVANTTLVTQTLEERSYTYAGVTTRVRRSTAIEPNWTSGGDRGWKVALPAGERITGDGSFIEGGRFYFTGHNPTVSYLVPNTTTTVYGENWLMELNYLTGGSSTQPFLDMDGNLLLNSNDRIKYISGDTIPAGKAVGDLILTPSEDGIPVGKWLSRGVQSQPLLVQLRTLNTTLFNQNPDVTFPVAPLEKGVAGGHFDEDIYYEGTVTTTPGVKATATITVGTTGYTNPATLGGIAVDGTTIVPALTVSDIADGTASSTNATTIKNKITGGYSASVAGNVVTITAPATGASYNGKTFTITAGTSSAGSPGTAPANGTLIMTAVAKSKGISIKCGSTFIGQSAGWTSSSSGTASTRLSALYSSINGTTVNGYTMTCSATPDTAAPTSLTCSISAPVGPSACSGGFTVDSDITKTTNTGPSGGSAATGWDDFAPALTGGTFSGGTDDVTTLTSSSPCNGGTIPCTSKKHVHEYDDIYDKTGVNMLDASNILFDLSNAIPSTSIQFKVLAQNQYLSPAVKLHIGNPSYVWNVDSGYIPLSGYTTGSTLDLATLPTYTRDTIGSLAINMPVDAFTAKNWWNGALGLAADVRVGLHPTQTGCVKSSKGVTDGNMYQPIIPPANGVDGPGTLGYNAGTTPATATGVRHGGALVIQIISASTPNSAIEMSLPGRPEYGWRVKSAFYSTYVLAEYTTFWHDKLGGQCYGDAGWTKLGHPDNRICGTADTATERKCATELSAASGTDPKIGTFGAAATISSVTTVVVGNVTTITINYTDGTHATIVRTANADGSVTIVTTDADGNVTTEIVANSSGNITSGGDERGMQTRTGRVSWHELIRGN